MAKPVTLPRWADLAVPADIVDPPSGKKDSGWLTAEKPAHSYFNWYMNLVYQWTQYLDNLTNEALTWTAVHTFNQHVFMNRGLEVVRGVHVGVALAVDGGISASAQAASGGIGVYATSDGAGSHAFQAVPSSSAAGGIISPAPSNGLSTQYGVKGAGVDLAPGLLGTAGNTIGGVGVLGTATNAAAYGVSATNAGGGVAMIATVTGAGTAIQGISTASSAFGGHFQANGLSGGAALRAQATDPSGTAVTIIGKTVSTGDIEIPNTKVLRYATTKQEVRRVPVPSFQPGSNASFADLDNSARWRSSNTAAYGLVSTAGEIPSGATLANVEFYFANTDSVSRVIAVSVILYDYTGTAPIITALGSTNLTYTAGETGWKALACSGVMPEISLHGGHLEIGLTMPTTTSNFQLRFEACRLIYTFTDVARDL